MEKRIITVSRQFGSGGRTVGKHLAEKLGVPFYDKELVKKVAEETGLDAAFVEEKGEFSPSKSFSALLCRRGFSVCLTGFRSLILFTARSGRLF